MVRTVNRVTGQGVSPSFIGQGSPLVSHRDNGITLMIVPGKRSRKWTPPAREAGVNGSLGTLRCPGEDSINGARDRFAQLWILSPEDKGLPKVINL